MNIFKKFIFSSFIKPLLLTFTIVMLILLMQFLWKYIDDLIGKGLDFSIIIELLWYSSVTLIPIALPLSVLLASIMLIGGMAERSEITALNALGQPFLYLFKPLIIFSVLIAIFSFIISNYAIPFSNLKATNLMYDIMQKKLNVNIQEKVFFSDIEGFSIRVEEKKPNGLMSNIIIYDYSDKMGITKIFTSKTAKMGITNNNQYLLIHLMNGENYNEVTNNSDEYILKTTFDKYDLKLDLSSFQMERTTAERFSNRAKTMNIQQLQIGLDSLNKENERLQKNIIQKFKQKNKNKREYKLNDISKEKILMSINQKEKHLNNYQNQLNILTKKINKFHVELHRKFTLSIACIVMLIIGAPIGAIIKKGGFGLPVVFSIILFLIYHIISITGEKMVKKDLIEPIIGMWGSTYIMLIIGFILLMIVNKNQLIQKK